jgi:hypothetical protein
MSTGGTSVDPDPSLQESRDQGEVWGRSLAVRPGGSRAIPSPDGAQVIKAEGVEAVG